MGCDLSPEGMRAWINGHFAACNAGDVDRIAGYFEPDGAHYFPPGMYAMAVRGDAPRRARWPPAPNYFFKPPSALNALAWTGQYRRSWKVFFRWKFRVCIARLSSIRKKVSIIFY